MKIRNCYVQNGIFRVVISIFLFILIEIAFQYICTFITILNVIGVILAFYKEDELFKHIIVKN